MLNAVVLLLFVCPSLLFALDCETFKTCKECPDHFEGNKQLCEWCVPSNKCVGLHSISCAFRDKITRASDCPIDEKDGYEYSDATARKMLDIAAAAYAEKPQLCLTNKLGAKLKRLLNVTPMKSEKDSFTGFTAVSPKDHAIIISFKGSNGDQLISEGYNTILKDRVAFIGGGKVSSYFHTGFISLWNAGLKDDFLTLKDQNPGYKLWVTGHSLGGAMASIAAGYIIKTGLFASPNVKLITFGQPRTGDHDYSAAHDELMTYSYRVVHKHDMVPHIPPKGFEDYYHHRYEIWYNNDMAKGAEYEQCNVPEGDDCSNSSLNKFSVADHQNYFGVERISSYGKNGCTTA